MSVNRLSVYFRCLKSVMQDCLHNVRRLDRVMGKNLFSAFFRFCHIYYRFIDFFALSRLFSIFLLFFVFLSFFFVLRFSRKKNQKNEKKNLLS